MSRELNTLLLRQRTLLAGVWPGVSALSNAARIYEPDGGTVGELRARTGASVAPCGMLWPAEAPSDRWGCCTCGVPVEIHGPVALARLLAALHRTMPALFARPELGPCESPVALGRHPFTDEGWGLCRCGYPVEAHASQPLALALVNAVVALVARDGTLDPELHSTLASTLEGGFELGEFTEHFCIPARHWDALHTQLPAASCDIFVDPPSAPAAVFVQVGDEPMRFRPASPTGLVPVDGRPGEDLNVLLLNNATSAARLRVSVVVAGAEPESLVACDEPKFRGIGRCRCGVALRNHSPLALASEVYSAVTRAQGQARSGLAQFVEQAQIRLLEPHGPAGAGYVLPLDTDLAAVSARMNGEHPEARGLLLDRLIAAAEHLLARPDHAHEIEALLVEAHGLLLEARDAIHEPHDFSGHLALLSMDLTLAFHELMQVGQVVEARLVCLRASLSRIRLPVYARDRLRPPEFGPRPPDNPRELEPDDDATEDDDSDDCRFELFEEDPGRACDGCGRTCPASELHDADTARLPIGLLICDRCLSKETTMNANKDAPDIPINTDVILTDDQGRRWRTRTRSMAWRLGDGTRVQQVEGIAGGYLVERLMRGTDPTLPHFADRFTETAGKRGAPW